MTKRVAVFAILAVLLVAAVPVYGEPLYTVKESDTLWWLQGMATGDPTQWRGLVQKNPFLQEPGRIFQKDGKTIAIIRPGEKLAGLEALGILPKVMKAEEVGFSQDSSRSFWFLSLAALAVLVLAFLIGFLLYLRAYRRLNRRTTTGDPALAGPPVIPGGLSRTRVAEISDRLDQVALRHYMETSPAANISAARPRRVSEIREGVLSGTARIHYANGIVQTRIFRNEPAYAARFQFPDSHEEEMYFLQRCANDAFRVGEDSELTFAPRENAAPVAPAPPREPVPAAASVPEFATTEFVMKGYRLRVPVGTTVRATANGFTVSLTGPGDVGITQTRPKRPARRRAPAASS